MKKSLTFALAFAASMSVNAQEVCQIDAAGAGLTSTATEVAAGTVVGTSENLTISILNVDKVKATDCKMHNDGFVIGGKALLADGITGSSNPSNAGGNPALFPADGVPTNGFAINIAAKADGFVYVCAKLSSNKNYYVFEEGTMIGYDLAMWCDAEETFQPLTISVENDSEINGFPCRTATVAWPEVIFTGDETSAKKVNGEGVIKFPVAADCNYVVGAGGSKISVCGAVFSTSGDLAVVLPESEYEDTDKDTGAVTASGTEPAHTIMGGNNTGISSVAIDNATDAPAYNIAGQRVSKDAKGLVIVGGKKYVNK